MTHRLLVVIFHAIQIKKNALGIAPSRYETIHHSHDYVASWTKVNMLHRPLSSGKRNGTQRKTPQCLHVIHLLRLTKEQQKVRRRPLT